jgi:hypothetical protein
VFSFFAHLLFSSFLRSPLGAFLELGVCSLALVRFCVLGNAIDVVLSSLMLHRGLVVQQVVSAFTTLGTLCSKSIQWIVDAYHQQKGFDSEGMSSNRTDEASLCLQVHHGEQRRGADNQARSTKAVFELVVHSAGEAAAIKKCVSLFK